MTVSIDLAACCRIKAVAITTIAELQLFPAGSTAVATVPVTPAHVVVVVAKSTQHFVHHTTYIQSYNSSHQNVKAILVRTEFRRTRHQPTRVCCTHPAQRTARVVTGKVLFMHTLSKQIHSVKYCNTHITWTSQVRIQACTVIAVLVIVCSATTVPAVPITTAQVVVVIAESTGNCGFYRFVQQRRQPQII